MSRRLALATIAALAAVLAPPAPAQDALPRVLRVGTSGDYAPFSVKQGDAITGFDVEVARRFARQAGLDVEWVAFRWPELAGDLAADRFDVAMSGVTWTPERATRGYLTRAVAASGACLIGDPAAQRIGVNRGGALERFARRRYAGAEIRSVDDNRSLPSLLASGEVDAIVTDRFEIAFFRRGDAPEHCEPPTERKVYWVAPPRAHDLGPRLDAWLARNEDALAALRERWLGAPEPRGEIDNLIDLLARRLALMPAVAHAKAARALPTEDAARETRVRARVRARARRAGLDADSVEALFRLQITLGKRVQERARDAADVSGPAPDLEQALRPAIGRLGDRIVASLAALAPLDAAALGTAAEAPLEPWLTSDEREALRAALLAVRTTERRAPN